MLVFRPHGGPASFLGELRISAMAMSFFLDVVLVWSLALALALAAAAAAVSAALQGGG
jgi:uncharacterized RDD family membrane protein YckC